MNLPSTNFWTVVYLGMFFKYTNIFSFFKLNMICQLTMYTFQSVSFPTYLLHLITFYDENWIFVWLLYLSKACQYHS